MGLSAAEFDAMLADDSKRIDGDIDWDSGKVPWQSFQVDIASDAGYPLVLKGSYNPLVGKLSFSVLMQGEGRVYALDLGRDHKKVGETHKHRYQDAGHDVYAPPDITALPHEVELAWEQFCREARITHNGTLRPPKPAQREML